jgi:SpoVK/Ycf46/Vps4 family AAA+-type ATPase
MEQYEGIAILATNLRANLDEAFVRRLAYTVRFSFPGEAERLKIWQQIWPSRKLLAPDVDLTRLAGRFKLSGGNIRNIALSATYFAAAEKSKVTMAHLLRALGREYEKVGKSVSQEELQAALAPEAIT